MKLYQIDNKLFVSEIEMPKREDFNDYEHIQSFAYIDDRHYENALTEWKKQAVEVAESEKEKFMDLAYELIDNVPNIVLRSTLNEALQQGINLPENSVYTKGELVNENGRDTHKIFAYLNTQPKITNEPYIEKIIDVLKRRSELYIIDGIRLLSEKSVIAIMTKYQSEFLSPQTKGEGVTDEKIREIAIKLNPVSQPLQQAFIQGFKSALSLPPQQGEGDNNEGWISVEDRLPTKSIQEVICVRKTKDGDNPYSIPLTWRDGKFQFFFETYITITDVTHWQPLPKAPISN